MVQINWTDLAKNDLKEIYDYISKDSRLYAKRQIVRIQSRATLLETAPLSGRKVPEFAHDAFRELIEGNYRIVYKVISNSRIDILTVHHSSRDLLSR